MKSKDVRQQVVDMFVHVDKAMATTIADGVGVNRPTGEQVNGNASSPALSQANTTRVPYTLKVGVLIGNGFNGAEVEATVKTLRKYGVTVDIVGEKLGTSQVRMDLM